MLTLLGVLVAGASGSVERVETTTHPADAGLQVLPVGVPPREGGVPEGRPDAGRFLVARRQVTGPFFSRSVVLLLDASPEGAVGLIINRPTDVQLASVVPEMPALEERGDKLWFGGPVAPDTLMLLVRASAAPPDSRRILPGVYATRNAETLRALASSQAAASRFHAYIGYAGWAPGQLDAELARGDWHVVSARPKLIFESSASEIWPALMRELDGVHVRAPGDTKKSRRIVESAAACPEMLLYDPRPKFWSVDALRNVCPKPPRAPVLVVLDRDIPARTLERSLGARR